MGLLGSFLVLFILFCWRLEARIREIQKAQDEGEGRLIGVEVKEYSQDTRLDAIESAVERHAKFMVRTKREVDDLARDVGWNDDRRQTQVMLPSTTQNLLDELKKPKE